MFENSFMTFSSDSPNLLSIANVRTSRNDTPAAIDYHPNMPRKRTPQAVIGPDWFINEWMAQFDLKQADMIRKCGWSKARASEIANGQTSYYREIVNTVASVLEIHPFELLMHPDEAFRLRRLRETALAIAAEERADFTPAELPSERLLPARRKG